MAALLAGLMMMGATAAFATPIPGTALQTVLDTRTQGGASSVNVATDYLAYDSYWNVTASGGSIASFIVELTNSAGQSKNTFGVYDRTDPNKKLQLFGGGATTGNKVALFIDTDTHEFTVGSTTKTFGSNTFGYYLGLPDFNYNAGHFWYSDTSLNTAPSDRPWVTGEPMDHMFAYQGPNDMFSIKNTQPNPSYANWTPNEYILAWEDYRVDGLTESEGAVLDFQDLVVMVESVEPIPEPGTIVLLGAGLLGLGIYGRRRMQK